LSKGFSLTADVLKVGHHGSATSTSKKFLKRIKPEYAAISVGESSANNPKSSVLDRLSKFGVKTLRTDLNGKIIFATDGKEMKVITEK
jgi:beta-lactamase superfamily II metal-dependent hydrolase